MIYELIQLMDMVEDLSKYVLNIKKGLREEIVHFISSLILVVNILLIKYVLSVATSNSF